MTLEPQADGAVSAFEHCLYQSHRAEQKSRELHGQISSGECLIDATGVTADGSRSAAASAHRDSQQVIRGLRERSRVHLARHSSRHACRRGERSVSVLSDAFGPPPARQHRQVVVTGLGLVTPLGIGVQAVWQRLLAGESGTRALVPEDLPEACRTLLMVCG